jgi:uncharacterized membrane protein
MTPRWEKVEHAPATQGPLVMDAVLTPHRSLGARAFLQVMLAFAGLNALIALYFAYHGAWPVLFFLVLDVALLYVAFRINYRDGKLVERVKLDHGVLHVSREPVKGAPAHWVVHPHWARVIPAARSVRVVAGGRALEFGAFLSPGERRAFSAALREALLRAAKGQGHPA